MLRRTLEEAAADEEGGMLPAGSSDDRDDGSGVYASAVHIGGITGVAYWSAVDNVLCGCEGADSGAEGWCAPAPAHRAARARAHECTATHATH